MSMSWDNPRTLDAICYDLVTADMTRGQNRARIQNLANGFPPYSKQEEEANQIVVNINDLTHTRMLHDARSQYANAFLKNEKYARATTDGGPVHKRDQRSSVVTREWGKQMKQSIRFFERKRAGFGNLVLHGISPGVWSNEDDWCTKPLGVEDVLLPGETLLGFENLPFIIFRRTLTSIELYNLTRKENRDPGWNMRMVNSLMDWLEQEATVLRSLNWPEVWSPEKIAERTKQEAGGTLAGDRAPKIDLFDIYAFDDSKGTEGWVRRIILDSWSEPTFSSVFHFPKVPAGHSKARSPVVVVQLRPFFGDAIPVRLLRDLVNTLCGFYYFVSFHIFILSCCSCCRCQSRNMRHNRPT